MSNERKSLIFYKKPKPEADADVKEVDLIAGFSGWADAGYISTYCLNYLISKLQPEKFAEIISDEFYVLSNLEKRPKVLIENACLEAFNYPTMVFYFWRGDGGRNVILSVGPEPDLKWDEFLDVLAVIVEEMNIKMIYTIGGVLSGEREITAVVNQQDLKNELSQYNISSIRSYKGPSSIHSAMLSYFGQKNIKAITLWGNTPISQAEDPKSWYEMVKKITQIFGIVIDLEDLKRWSEEFEKKIKKEEKKEKMKQYEQPYFW
jgi:proteasome assembly chaperone (PAC2) family protein